MVAITPGQGDNVRFTVPGGHIDVTLEDGRLRVHGVNDFGTHSSQLTIQPESGNDITVGLTPLQPPPLVKRATFVNGTEHKTKVTDHRDHWDVSCSGCQWTVVNLKGEANALRAAANHEERWNG